MGKPMTLVADMPWSLPFSSTGSRVQLSELQNVSPDGWIVNGQIKFRGNSRETQWQASCRISMLVGGMVVICFFPWPVGDLYFFFSPPMVGDLYFFFFFGRQCQWLVICMNTWRPTRAPEANSLQTGCQSKPQKFLSELAAVDLSNTSGGSLENLSQAF